MKRRFLYKLLSFKNKNFMNWWSHPPNILLVGVKTKNYLKNDFPLYVLSKLNDFNNFFIYFTGVKFPLLLGKRRLWRFLSKKNFNFWYAKYRFTKLLSCKIFQTPFLRKASLFPKEMDFTGKWDIIIISVLFLLLTAANQNPKDPRRKTTEISFYLKYYYLSLIIIIQI